MDGSDPKNPDSEANLKEVNAALSEWAARSTTESDALIERLEAMGYAVRGKSESEITDILRHPPARPPR